DLGDRRWCIINSDRDIIAAAQGAIAGGQAKDVSAGAGKIRVINTVDGAEGNSAGSGNFRPGNLDRAIRQAIIRDPGVKRGESRKRNRLVGSGIDDGSGVYSGQD